MPKINIIKLPGLPIPDLGRDCQIGHISGNTFNNNLDLPNISEIIARTKDSREHRYQVVTCRTLSDWLKHLVRNIHPLTEQWATTGRRYSLNCLADVLSEQFNVFNQQVNELVENQQVEINYVDDYQLIGKATTFVVLSRGGDRTTLSRQLNRLVTQALTNLRAEVLFFDCTNVTSGILSTVNSDPELVAGLEDRRLIAWRLSGYQDISSILTWVEQLATSSFVYLVDLERYQDVLHAHLINNLLIDKSVIYWDQSQQQLAFNLELVRHHRRLFLNTYHMTVKLLDKHVETVLTRDNNGYLALRDTYSITPISLSQNF